MKPTKGKKKRRAQLRRRWLCAACVPFLLLILALAWPKRVVRGAPAPVSPAESLAATAAPTVKPTVKPTAAPEICLLGEKSIYYPFDPELFVTDSRGRISYSGEGYTCLTGIDVSEHQYDINWQKVAADGIDFAIIRTGYRGYTSGGIYEDKFFRQNIEGALANGIKVGVYFFSQATDTEEATAEAAYVLSMIEENDVDVTYPVVFDWEMDYSSNARVNGVSRDTVTKCAAAFCQKIRGAGYTPCIYFNTVTGYLVYDLDQLSDYDFWLAEYNDKPSFYYGFQLWQNSCTGTVAGIDCDVDMDMAMKKYTP